METKAEKIERLKRTLEINEYILEHFESMRDFAERNIAEIKKELEELTNGR